MHKTRILGTGIYTPKTVKTNFDLEKMMDTSDQWIRERTGIHERRIGKPENNEYPSTMGTWAAEKAIEAAGIEPNDIDMILFASCTSDYPLPNCAVLVQQALGITNKCAAFDIAAACTGFVYGFNMANSFIQSGMCKKVLVIGSELLSPEVDWNDRTTCILFGDAAAAAVVGRSEEGEDSQVYSSTLGADGSGKDFFFKKFGGAVHPITPEVIGTPDAYMKMKGQEMFKVAVRTLAQNGKKVVEDSGYKLEDVDWIVPHQANIRIIEACANTLGAPMEKVIVNIHKYGNTSAATVPMAFHEAIEEGKIKRGDLVLFDAFGAGLTSGATLLRY